MNFLIQQFTQLLVFLNELFGSLGWSIVAFTALIRLVLLPLTLSSIKAQKKLKDLQPELKKITKLHKNNKPELQKAQLELYQKYNINPLAGCLPQLAQIFVLIVLYRALLTFLENGTSNGANLQFYWLNLSQPDATYILPVLAGVTQLALSLMIAPGAEIPDVVSNKNRNKKVQQANKKEEDTAEMAATMQQQMLFIMPLMTGFLAARFPSGLALYWVVATIFSVAQQHYVSGWGGLTSYYQRFLLKLKK
jgi:YidC/Oxa1 family membrane protein insertase